MTNTSEKTCERFTFGQIIYYTTAHLGLLISPENGEDVWRAGLFLKYLNDGDESCIIIDSLGKERKCPLYMIQTMQL